MAGVLFLFDSPYLAIQLNAVALFISAVIILFLPNLELRNEKLISEKVSMAIIFNDWKRVVGFSKLHTHIALVYVLFSGVIVFMSALDSLEAAFATEVLSLSESTYGFLVSIAGMGMIAGALINALFTKYLKLNILIGFGAMSTSIGYVIFAFSSNFILAAIGVFLLTFALAFANTGFLTFYQNNIPVEMMGRFSSVFSLVEAFFIILFTASIGLFAELFEIRQTYILGSMVFLILGVIINMIVLNKSKRNYYQEEIG
ncbi:MFS transporter [Oceanobacillus locisalsi]|uniref:MFS transporter n=1 Tax=Oceanobacillus locisalsi TaxID=546107 RepID=A0ABW3NJ12_9BACI